MNGLCPECEQRPVKARGLCGPCWKRLVWRPRGGPAVERDRAASRACKKNYRGVCIDCGGETSWPGSHGLPTRCRACNEVANPIGQIGAAYMKGKFEARRQRIVALWNDGLTLRQIAAEIGTTRDAIGTTIVLLRKQGYDLPYRRTPEQVERIRAGTRAGMAA